MSEGTPSSATAWPLSLGTGVRMVSVFSSDSFSPLGLKKGTVSPPALGDREGLSSPTERAVTAQAVPCVMDPGAGFLATAH